MKPLKYLGFVLSVATILSACDPISGRLQVGRSFTVKTAAGDPQMGGACPADLYPCANEEKVETIQPGSYNMEISQFGGDNIRIQLGSGSKTMNIDLALPDGQDIPSTGNIALSSQQTGQPFDLQAQTQTTVTRTEPRRDIESCQITWQERVCGLVPGGPNGKPVHKCRTETFSRPGSRDVEYYYKTTHQDMQAQILAQGSQVATFVGSRTSTDKIYLYEGPCIDHRYGHRL